MHMIGGVSRTSSHVGQQTLKKHVGISTAGGLSHLVHIGWGGEGEVRVTHIWVITPCAYRVGWGSGVRVTRM